MGSRILDRKRVMRIRGIIVYDVEGYLRIRCYMTCAWIVVCEREGEREREKMNEAGVTFSIGSIG